MIGTASILRSGEIAINLDQRHERFEIINKEIMKIAREEKYLTDSTNFF